MLKTSRSGLASSSSGIFKRAGVGRLLRLVGVDTAALRNGCAGRADFHVRPN